MDERQWKILQAIIESFVTTANPVGSKYLFDEYDLNVSPATIRNDMALLEKEGFISQPHTSAGRVPTSMAYRAMVNQMKLDSHMMTRARKDLLQVRDQILVKRAKEKLYDTVLMLSQATGNVSFATLPDKERAFYIGVSNILRKPEFAMDPTKTTQVLEVLEHELYDILADLNITEEANIFIGEENILPEFNSCSLLAQTYELNGFVGVMGVLGSTRMDYPYNMAALKTAITLLNEQ